MWANTIVKLRSIAVEAQQLKTAILRESILSQPLIKIGTTMTNFTTMLGSISIHMVNCKHIGLRLTTTSTNTTISSNNLLTKIRIPDLMIGLITRLKTGMFPPITVGAKNLISRGETILSQPLIETMTITSETTMSSTIILNMVNRQESNVRLAAEYTDRTIMREDLITKIVPESLLNSTNRVSIILPTLFKLLITLLTQNKARRSKSMAFDTKTLLLTTSIERLTSRFLTGYTLATKTRFSMLIAIPVIKSCGKPAITMLTVLLRRLIKESALNEIIRYNVLHVTDLSVLTSRLWSVSALAGANTSITSLFYFNASFLTTTTTKVPYIAMHSKGGL
jgi:hypothetical protein